MGLLVYVFLPQGLATSCCLYRKLITLVKGIKLKREYRVKGLNIEVLNIPYSDSVQFLFVGLNFQLKFFHFVYIFFMGR